ncbi:class II aldolase/adducin family protein [Georgenia daeguensis]|uniref:Class II aldolase/adducin family protein n=1 Tax=Georgenia daeguensis TaxID=908355 RepID=A0ABP8EYM8_9MICO
MSEHHRPAADTPLIAGTLAVSRRLGQDPYLVLHGGGNTSAKNDRHMWVKASGFDLGHLTKSGLVPVSRAALARMLTEDSVSDTEMIDRYRAALIRPEDPLPTIEALLHHALPSPVVLHTHADAIVALTDTVHGPHVVREALGQNVLVLPYVMPGFRLAKEVLAAWQAYEPGSPAAVVLAHHGLFTTGHDPAEALDHHLELVARAESYIFGATGVLLRSPFAQTRESPSPELDRLREKLHEHATGPLVVAQYHDTEIETFLRRPDVADITQRGPTTLEHVIRTKRVPLLGDDVDAFVANYRAYYDLHRHRTSVPTRMLDPVPRVVLHPRLGLITTGPDAAAVRAVQDIYRHTIRIITAAEALGGYRTMTPAHAFDIEYWELEQRRLRPSAPAS